MLGTGIHRWGAARKARLLQEQYPRLLDGFPAGREALGSAEILKDVFHLSNIRDRDSTRNLDHFAIRKAIQKLSEEKDPEILLKIFLEIAIENAGADKGYLILEKDENLFIEAAKE